MTSESAHLTALRSAAEKQLAAKKAWLTPDANVDQFKLLHELQVQQIELEMQNEVLTDALAQVELLRAKYQDLYERAPVGYFTLSRTGEILELNQCASRLLGLSSDKLVGRQLREFFENSSLADLELFLTRVRQSAEEVFAHSLQIRRKQQMPVYVNAQARTFLDASNGQPTMRLSMMDVSTLKSAREDVIHAIGKASNSNFGPL
jgi:PAS domain S-box-containing protein